MSFPVDDEKFGSADRNRNVYSSNSSRRSYAESFSSEQPIVHAREDNMGSSHLTTESEADEHAEVGASKFELFYDLWFVANLNTFTSVHEITDEDTLKSFMGFILLLWTTWYLTTIFDVRFGVDGILQRIARGAHLAVMVGFAEAGSTFDPTSQVQGVFQAMSLFLMVSRLSLAIQYSITAFRGHRRIGNRKAILYTIGFHLVFALTYLGVSFYTTHNPKSNVFTFWYYAALAELVIHSLHARLSSTLSFLGTHLTERLNLLTLIILGEGIIIITKKVAILVENTWIKGNETSWSPGLIGTIASAAALAYIIFQLYFDWMHEDGGSNLTTHILWILFHMPFHISLVLLVEGGNQFIVWRRAIEAIDSASATLETAAFGFQELDNTKDIVERIKEPIMSLLEAYKPSDEITTLGDVNAAFSDMETIPDEFWSVYEQLSENQPIKRRWLDDISRVVSAVFNGINNSFEITDTDDNLLASPDNDFISVVKDNGYGKLQDDFGFRSVESDAYIATTEKFRVVFVYTFVCAGLVLALLVALHLLSKRQRWTHFNTFKTTFNFMVALLLSVISLLSLSTDALTRALMFPWQLPVIAVSYFIALVLTHIQQPSHVFLAKIRGNWVKMKDPKPTAEKEKDSSNWV